MTTTTPATPRDPRTWPTLVVLAATWAVTAIGQIWIFGLLFLAWAAYDIAMGESYFLQRIKRNDNPLVFWAIELSWIGFGLLWILYPS